MTQLASLRDLYIEELKDIYSAEKLIVAGLPKMVNKAVSPDLKESFNEHLEQTRTQVQRLEQIFEELGEQPSGKLCKGMTGILEEAREMMAELSTDAVMDACLISQAQHVEHYEMASYGSAIAFARMLGETDAVKLLETTLNEEKRADVRLTTLANQHVNRDAHSAQSGSTERRRPVSGFPNRPSSTAGGN
jgi:ferritin-like metal-binding protein YciE